MKQGRTAMRVNTDGVLIGAWVDLSPSYRNLLDIGTGCGTIAVMLAQRLNELCGESGPIFITGLEPHSGSFCDAKENFEAACSLFSNRNDENGINLNAKNLTLKEYMNLCERDEAFRIDLIISNPPYFSRSLKSSDANKSLAKHADALPQSEIIRAAESLLSEQGRLALILPDKEADSFIRKISLTGMFTLTRFCKVRTTTDKPFSRYMMEFGRKLNCPSKLIEEQFTLMENGKFTISYMELTQSFYLNF